MVDLKDFITLMDEVSPLYQKEKEERERLRAEKENSFSALCEELRFLYEEERSRAYHEYIEPFINENSFLKESSSLYIIKKQKWETYHSLFLKYIWNNQTEFGNIAFQNFLKGIGITGSWLNSISKNSYSLEEEHYTGIHRKIDLSRKRIDLLLVDKENNWLVVIENKIESKVNYDKKKHRSQLRNYREYCEHKYQGYHHKEFILLSYTEKNKNNSESGWRYADYSQLFRSLFPFRSQDALLKDYLKTLFCLLFPEEWEDDYENVSLYRCMLFYNDVISKIQ